MAWQRVRIEIPEDLTPKEREALGDAVIEHIVERSESGKGIYRSGRGFTIKDFPGYSESYVASLDFANAGKSKGQTNLTLSGDMLASIDLLSHQKGSILIGFENGTEENDRAEGNQLGSYGGDPNPSKARPFLGVTPSELRTLIKKVEE